jgi:hypothetical protein
MCLFNSKPAPQILLLPVRQERHELEKATPLLAELISASTSTKEKEIRE